MSEDRTARILKLLKRFAEATAAESELYRRLTLGVIDDEYLLDLAAHAPEGQPPANMLFAAVHYLLLGGVEHELAAFYPTVSGAEPPAGDPFPVFSDFCRQFRDDMLPLLAGRRVQTNEVRRAIVLLPGFEEVARRSHRRLATVEVGTAAGLLTLWDLYRYDYGEAGQVGDEAAALTLHTEVRGDAPPIGLPARAWSAGIDINPIDLSHPDEVTWLRSLIWPDQVERMERIDAAIEVARANPPNLIGGDGLDMLGEVVAQAPDDAVVVVHHSFALNQVSKEDRQSFNDEVAWLGSERDLFLVSVLWDANDLNFELVLGTPRDGQLDIEPLARVHHHGEWISWGPDPPRPKPNPPSAAVGSASGR